MKTLRNNVLFIIAYIKLWFYLQKHPIEDLEKQLLRMGITPIKGEFIRVYHLPKGGRMIFDYKDYSVEVIPHNSTQM